MNTRGKYRKPLVFLLLLIGTAMIATGWLAYLPGAYADATGQIRGQVLGGGVPIANSTVTLWAAGAGAPMQVARTQTDADGRFTLSAAGAPGNADSLYLIAQNGRPTSSKTGGDNPHIALMTVVGANVPDMVTTNQFTTIASVWTHAQFIDGTAIKGQPLQLKIAAGNVPSFVDIQTGGWGAIIGDSLNGPQ